VRRRLSLSRFRYHTHRSDGRRKRCA
jgi:hypothetical protein